MWPQVWGLGPKVADNLKIAVDPNGLSHAGVPPWHFNCDF